MSSYQLFLSFFFLYFISQDIWSIQTHRSMKNNLLVTLTCVFHWNLSHGFTLLPSSSSTSRVMIQTKNPFILFAGFGNTNKKSIAAKKSTGAVLKPKAQWDRFLDLKQDGSSSCHNTLRVAVRKMGTEEWLEAGRVRAKDDSLEGLIAAVTVQRSLIAEHAKRLFPLRIQSKDKIEWGYSLIETSDTSSASSSSYIPINVKQVMEEIQDDVDYKVMGFEGTPDVATGYYCNYGQGMMGPKVVNLMDTTNNASQGEPNSKGAKAL